MNLLCPHCQKMVSVPDESAGQVRNCPLCNSAFTVPALPGVTPPPMPLGDLPDDIALAPPETVAPSPVVPAPSGHEDAVYRVVPEPPKPTPPPPPRRPAASSNPASQTTGGPSPTKPPPPAPPSAAAEPPPSRSAAPSAYTHTTTVRLNPHVLALVPPIALALVFVLLFFPWVGVYPGGYGIYTQNAFRVLTGSYSADSVGEEALTLDNKIHGEPAVSAETLVAIPWSASMLLYVLCVLGALVLSFAPAVTSRAAFRLPAGLERLWPWRSALVAGLALVGLLLLLLQLGFGFGMEKAVHSQVEKDLAADREKANTPEKQTIVDIRQGLELSRFSVHRTIWFDLAILCQFIALLAAGSELWIERRGQRPLPQALFQC